MPYSCLEEALTNDSQDKSFRLIVLPAIYIPALAACRWLESGTLAKGKPEHDPFHGSASLAGVSGRGTSALFLAAKGGFSSRTQYITVC
jgi:hypothetical protein